MAKTHRVLLKSLTQLDLKLTIPNWTITTGREFCFGRKSTEQLVRICTQESWQRVLIVTDKVLEACGIVEQVTAVLKSENISFRIYDGSEIEPSTDHAMQALALAEEFEPDAWLGLGGGSNMDLAKMCCAAHALGQDPGSLFGWNQVPRHHGKLVCIPTTAGTGSELSHAAIVKDAKTGKKTPVLSQNVRPDYAIVDPSFLATCPPKVAAESGIDALTHAIEAYLSTEHIHFDGRRECLPYEGNHPMGDLYAERAIELIGKHLSTAVSGSDNASKLAAAQDGMAFAASLAGAAFASCGVTICHALEYWVGDRYPCSHGAGNGILLPHVMRHVLPVRSERLAKISTLLGNRSTPEDAIIAVESLRSSIKLPSRLSEVSAREDELPTIAAQAFELKRLLALMPQPTTEEDLQNILRAAY